MVTGDEGPRKTKSSMQKREEDQHVPKGWKMERAGLVESPESNKCSDLEHTERFAKYDKTDL